MSLPKNLRGQHYGVLHLTVPEQLAASSNSPVFLDSSTLVDFLKQNGVDDPEFLLDLGAVYLNEKRVGYSPIRPGDYIRVHTKPRRYKRPPDLRERILEQKSDYILFDKPAGLPVHSQVDNQKENLLSFLQEELQISLFVTHRLDTVTSGCILVAKTPESQAEINLRFRERSILKNYVAEVSAPVAIGKHVHFMEQSFKSPKKVTLQETAGSLRCELVVEHCEATTEGRYRISIELLTGRPQQIRAQLAALGAPIVGDAIYGSKIKFVEDLSAIALRCSRLEFR